MQVHGAARSQRSTLAEGRAKFKHGPSLVRMQCNMTHLPPALPQAPPQTLVTHTFQCLEPLQLLQVLVTVVHPRAHFI